MFIAKKLVLSIDTVLYINLHGACLIVSDTLESSTTVNSLILARLDLEGWQQLALSLLFDLRYRPIMTKLLNETKVKKLVPAFRLEHFSWAMNCRVLRSRLIFVITFYESVIFHLLGNSSAHTTFSFATSLHVRYAFAKPACHRFKSLPSSWVQRYRSLVGQPIYFKRNIWF